MHRGFLRAGHLPTLVASFLYFDLSFMVWVLGPLAAFIARDLHLNAGQKGLIVAIPILAGAGAATVAAIGETLRAGTNCGSCRGEIGKIFARIFSRRPIPSRSRVTVD